MTIDVPAVLSALLALISLSIAIYAVIVPRRDQNDQQLLQQAILALERAYNSLTENGSKISPPNADRLNWLTSARHLISYKKLKNRINAEIYRTLCEEHEEFWRHQFYLALNMHKIHNSSYYDQGPPPGLRPKIEPRSAIVIYSFSSWPKSKVDPIDSVDAKQLMEESKLLDGNHGLREYLAKFPSITGGT